MPTKLNQDQIDGLSGELSSLDSIDVSLENKLSTEVEILAETIETRTNEFNSTFEKIKKELEVELDNLKKYNVMLQSVPTKIVKQIEETTPKIALELDAINNKKIEELKKQLSLMQKKQSAPITAENDEDGDAADF